MRLLSISPMILIGCGFQVVVGGRETPTDAETGEAVDGDLDSLVDPRIDAPIMTVDAPCGDDDDDGVCNDVDTWPCGVQPEPPGSPNTFDEVQNGDHITISLTNTTLTGGQRLHTVAPGATFEVTASYSIIDCICENCIDQIQIGLVPGDRKECLYSGNPSNPCTTATTGIGTRTLRAPEMPGVYDVRFRLGQDFDCDGQNNNNVGWWTNVPPGPNQTVARVCVH